MISSSPRTSIPFTASVIEEVAVNSAIRLLRGDDEYEATIVKKFETNISNYLGVKHAIAVDSGTAAIYLSLLAANVGPGDEVITTPLTYIGTTMAIRCTGADVIFADILPETLSIDPNDVRRKITPKTKAVLVVDLGGLPCNLSDIIQIKREYNIATIEDACQGFGSTYQGERVGTICDFTCFSFESTKPLPASVSGGMITVSNTDDAMRLHTLKNFGFQTAEDGNVYKKYAIREIGMRHTMHPIDAAVANAHLPFVQKRTEWRKHIVERYQHELDRAKDITMQKFPSDREGAYYSCIAFVQRRDQFIETMRQGGVTVMTTGIRNDLSPIFGGKRQDLPVLNRLEYTYVGLPINNQMTEDDITHVIQTVKKGW